MDILLRLLWWYLTGIGDEGPRVIIKYGSMDRNLDVLECQPIPWLVRLVKWWEKHHEQIS